MSISHILNQFSHAQTQAAYTVHTCCTMVALLVSCLQANDAEHILLGLSSDTRLSQVAYSVHGGRTILVHTRHIS